MQICEILNDDGIDVEMSFLALPLFVHHADEVVEPVELILPLFIREVSELTDVFALDAADGAAVGTNEIRYIQL